MIQTVRSKGKTLKGEVILPFSKSESNRALLIRALSGQRFNIHNLSDAADTLLLQKLLTGRQELIDCGPAGTTFRFLTAYFACQDGRNVVLTGNDRMKQRPIGPLVDALKKIGARITYIGQEGFPPLSINGTKLKGGKVTIDGHLSSQFISALLLIAPVLKNGLALHIDKPLVSVPYIEMTLKLMKHFGVDCNWKDNCITVPAKAYRPVDFKVSRDWSSASYWYEIAALSVEADLFMPGLNLNTAQGDGKVAGLMAGFGVHTFTTEEGIRIVKSAGEGVSLQRFNANFTDIPDLVQTFAVTCAALGIRSEINGIDHLKIKETDRIDAVCRELKKLGVQVVFSDGILHIEGRISEPIEENIVLNTYNDHRMAMAFAPLSLILGEVNIEDPDVVEKSYPQFWKEMQKFFNIHPKTITS